jgi:hypothetical protein
MASLVPNVYPEPELGTPLLIHPDIGCYLTPGEFYLCHFCEVSGNAMEKLTICGILSCDSLASSLKVKIFERSSVFYFDCYDVEPIVDSSIANYKEVYQSHLSQVIPLEAVVFPAFVLFEKGLLDCTKYPSLVGMSSLFLLRYPTNGKNIPIGGCLSFPSDCNACPLTTCFTKTALEEILRLCYSIQNSISHTDLRQGFFCRA